MPTCTFLLGEQGGCGRDWRVSWLLGALRDCGAGGRKGWGLPPSGGGPAPGSHILGLAGSWGHTHHPPVPLKARRQSPIHRGGPADWSSEQTSSCKGSVGSWTRSQRGPQGLPRAPAQPFLPQGAFLTHPSEGALPQDTHSLPAASVPSLPQGLTKHSRYKTRGEQCCSVAILGPGLKPSAGEGLARKTPPVQLSSSICSPGIAMTTLLLGCPCEVRQLGWVRPL